MYIKGRILVFVVILMFSVSFKFRMKKAVKGHLQLYRLLTGIADPPDMMYYRPLLWELMAMETLTFMKNIEFVVKINEYHSCL